MRILCPRKLHCRFRNISSYKEIKRELWKLFQQERIWALLNIQQPSCVFVLPATLSSRIPSRKRMFPPQFRKLSEVSSSLVAAKSSEIYQRFLLYCLFSSNKQSLGIIPRQFRIWPFACILIWMDELSATYSKC